MTGTVDSTDRGHPISAVLSRIADELKTVRELPTGKIAFHRRT